MAEASSEIKLNGLHHLALVCRDMERTVDFYTRVLGLKLKKGFDLPGYGQHFFFDMGNGSELAFFWFNDAEPAQPGVAAVKNIVGSRQGNISSAHGSMNHVAFSVSADDIVAYPVFSTRCSQENDFRCQRLFEFIGRLAASDRIIRFCWL